MWKLIFQTTSWVLSGIGLGEVVNWWDKFWGTTPDPSIHNTVKSLGLTAIVVGAISYLILKLRK